MAVIYVKRVEHSSIFSRFGDEPPKVAVEVRLWKVRVILWRPLTNRVVCTWRHAAHRFGRTGVPWFTLGAFGAAMSVFVARSWTDANSTLNRLPGPRANVRLFDEHPDWVIDANPALREVRKRRTRGPNTPTP